MTRFWNPSDTRTQSWSELECDTDFLGTTGRRQVQLAHKQEMAGATTQWGFRISPPHHIYSSLLTCSPQSLSISPSSNPALSSDPQASNSLYLSSYSPLHILISCFLTHPILRCKLHQKFKWKQEVINQWSVPFKGKTNCWPVPWSVKHHFQY